MKVMFLFEITELPVETSGSATMYLFFKEITENTQITLSKLEESIPFVGGLAHVYGGCKGSILPLNAHYSSEFIKHIF